MSEAVEEEAALRLLVIGSFAGPRASAGSAAVPIDKQGFNAVMERMAPGLDLVLDAPAFGGRLDVSLGFRALQDFEPAALARQLPPLAAAQELRNMCAQLASGEIDADAFGRAARERVPADLADALTAAVAGEAGPTPATPAAPQPAAGEAPAAGAGESSVDSILDMVGEPQASPAADARKLAGDLAGAVSRGSARAGRPGPAGRAESLLAERVGAGLDALLAAPELRALESVWRGLAFLVDRTDFREPIAVDVIASDVDGAAEALRDAGLREDYDLVLAAFELDATPRDLERAKQLAEAAMETQTPLLVGVAPAFLGVERWGDLGRAEMPQTIFRAAAYDGWRGLRGREEARWLNLVANRMVLRSPWGPEGKKPREIDYSEGGERPGCTGTGAWAVAANCTRAFARSGTCVQISGTRNGLVQDLGLAPAEGAREPLPVEGALGRERVEDLESIGLCAVDHYRGDSAYVGTLRCFKQPERYGDAEATADAVQHCALAYQIYAARFAKFLGRTLPEVIGMVGNEVGETLRSRIVAFLSTADRPLDPRRVGVRAEPDPDDAALTLIRLRVAPEFKIAGRDVNVLLSFAARI